MNARALFPSRDDRKHYPQPGLAAFPRRLVQPLLVLFLAWPAIAQYSARKDGDIVRLEDSAHQIQVAVAPNVGDIAFEMSVKGENVLRFPYADMAAFRAHPGAGGIPFLGPWANRLDEQAFYANGKRYAFNMDLGNVHGAHPIHGFLISTDKWTVTEVSSNGSAAWVTSRLEFYRQPTWMAQFPFAHTIELTYRLSGGALEVHLQLTNLSDDPMPVSVGFHPYYRLTDSPREAWTIAIGAKKQWLVNADKIPSGETAPIEQMFPDPNRIALKDYDLDHVYGDLVRGPDGRAAMRVKGKSQQLEVLFGPKYNTAVVYSPDPAKAAANGAPGRRPPQDPNFICFEPMAGITDAMNLAHKGLYHDLQMLAPREVWQESFWIRPSGF